MTIIIIDIVVIVCCSMDACTGVRHIFTIVIIKHEYTVFFCLCACLLLGFFWAARSIVHFLLPSFFLFLCIWCLFVIANDCRFSFLVSVPQCTSSIIYYLRLSACAGHLITMHSSYLYCTLTFLDKDDSSFFV